MSKRPAEKPLPLPQQGGTYTHEDGALKRAEQAPAVARTPPKEES